MPLCLVLWQNTCLFAEKRFMACCIQWCIAVVMYELTVLSFESIVRFHQQSFLLYCSHDIKCHPQHYDVGFIMDLSLYSTPECAKLDVSFCLQSPGNFSEHFCFDSTEKMVFDQTNRYINYLELCSLYVEWILMYFGSLNKFSDLHLHVTCWMVIHPQQVCACQIWLFVNIQIV